ncbi:substrate-binding domain-containing protein [Actinacidiphila acididurans]|uniref:Substrate-binding domain-containing protein n=1 Tax=Actinacidiphila acididurans TaxID=2784346 RepID=A0ABS2TZY4_9ACTN|nr:substrate-binding domain-containing protein [Actinacidiphila acididurans]MBM9508900.1 substrate-binding domain-containing protein [Actinacidiphila acididurans]
MSVDSIVAIVTSVIALGVTPFVNLILLLRGRGGQRIGYRVQLDTLVGGDNGGVEQQNVRLGLFQNISELPHDATVVLLRIENDGSVPVGESDYTSPNALTATFRDRLVRGIAVAQFSDEHLYDHFTAPGAVMEAGSHVHLPRVPLSRGQYYKLFVLLSGGPAGADVRVTGGLRAGKVHKNKARTVDATTPAISRTAYGIIGVFCVALAVLGALVVRLDTRQMHPMGCATGSLTVAGSTAFQPAAADLAARYEQQCPGSHITVAGRGSEVDTQQLIAEGDKAKGASPAVVVFSDGQSEGDSRHLQGKPVAVVAFALVVNDDVKVKDLPLSAIRKMYGISSYVTQWDQVGGPSGLPIRLVSRAGGSGTRNIFEQRVLGHTEPGRTSSDCAHPTIPSNIGPLRCELASTQDVLDMVGRTQGGIGYAELQAARDAKGVHVLSIGGMAPAAAADGSYPFAEIEYAYTYGDPAEGSLAESFLNYTLSSGGKEVLKSHGHLPCESPEGYRRCGQSG